VKRELRDKWVRALRSKDFQQGSGRLKDDNYKAYCCLGVLRSVVLGHDNWKGDVPYPAGRSPKVYQGMSIRDQKSLASMNDGGESFLTIADWIEQNIPVEDD
jgi:hypothetical protein